VVEPDNSVWATKLSALSPTPTIFFSALGTTKAQAGGQEQQKAIDYDLNLQLAKAAKEAGVKVYVLISSASPDANSRIFYSRMKGELERDVTALGFEHTIFVRPGLILGPREDSRPAEAAIQGVAKFLGGISGMLANGWSQDAGDIGRAAVSAGLQAAEGKVKEKVWFVHGADIIRLGKTEWK
jgi:uncharacterized protein YbjT (DUF2867 family)